MKTAHDLFTDLLETSNELGKGTTVREAKRAVIEALRDLANQRDWACYKHPGRIVTSDAYSTGTVAFDLTGGLYERMLTLSSGTWPSWAASGIVIISSVPYRVDERHSDTVITLRSETAPSADVAAGTSYSLYRQSYQLPENFKSAADFVLTESTRPLQHMSPENYHEHVSRNPTNTGQPVWYSIIAEEDGLERLALFLWPLPSDDYVIDYCYTRNPRSISTWDHTDGTVTTTSGSATVTGSGTNWTSRMEGAVFRASTSATKVPTGLDGDNPYSFEARIKQVVSATSLRLESTASSSLTAVKHRVSDPIDVEPGAMLNALARGAELAQARIKGLTSKVDKLERAYMDAVRLGAAGDSRSAHRRVAGSGGDYRIPMKNMPLGDDYPP